MQQFSVPRLVSIWLLLGLVSFAVAQDTTAAPDVDDQAGDECEEAWKYVEFLKDSVKEKVEDILQKTLFQPRPLLEETVTKTMEQVLEIRDDILARTKSIRTDDGEVIICPEQNIKQEEFLTQIRMQIMSILLGLIERDAATPEKLQDVGKQLLAIRTKVNGEITRMIMLRESSGITPRIKQDDCDCGILDEVLTGLDDVINQDADADSQDAATDDEADAAGGDDTNDDADAGSDDSAGGGPVEQLTMILMTVDGEIKSLYNNILGELNDEARQELSDELLNLKGISTDLHAALSKLSELEQSQNEEGIQRLIRRDVRSIRNEVKGLVDECKQNCPGECDSCGAEKIDEVSEKLNDYKLNLEDLDEEEAKETIRADLMAFLTQINSDMTTLLKEKAENGELDECGNEELDVINKIKGPLWMMVNITIFGDAATMNEMILALEAALEEMRYEYCGAEPSAVLIKAPTVECDLNEINVARDWITDIDTVISEDIFKSDDEDSRRKAMLGLIELKSSMEDRVRELFQQNLECKEEVEQIKNIYTQRVTECLSEMMNPRYRFDLLGRSERVECVKELRISMENRRGLLLMREIEARINQSGVDVAGPGGDLDGDQIQFPINN